MKYFLFIASFFCASVLFAQDKPEGLFINSKAADFKAKDQNGKEISLKELRKKGYVVVLFYRGNWCPYCSRQLRHFQDSLEMITAKGAQLVAITPEAAEGIDSTIAKTGVTFPVLYDEDLKISKKYQVAFKVDQKTVNRYKTGNIDLLKTNKQKEAQLPVPAVYVINTEGSVVYRFFNEDYRKRVSVLEILRQLPR